MEIKILKPLKVSNRSTEFYSIALKAPVSFENELSKVDCFIEIGKEGIAILRSIQAIALLNNIIDWVTVHSKRVPMVLGMIGELHEEVVFKGLYVYKDGYVFITQIEETVYKSDKFLFGCNMSS